MSVIAFSRAIGPVPIECRLNESHRTEIDITGIPIETGAEVHDHAYVMPDKLILEVADGNAAAAYNALVAFQKSRIPFTIVTGLTVFRDMLIQSIDADRDATTSRILGARITLQQVIIVSTARAHVEGADGSSSATPSGKPGGANSTTAAPPTATPSQATGTLQRGDVPSQTVPAPRSRSILSRVAA